MENKSIMKKTGFTLVEILVAIVILTVVASLSIATYQKTVNTNRNTICLQNLKVLQAAVDIYTLEKDTLPTTLSRLEPRHIYLAYEKVVGKQKENSFLVFLRNRFGLKPVWAQSLGKYYANNPAVLRCPADAMTNPPDIAKPFTHSYQLNTSTDVWDTTTKKLVKNSVFALIHDKQEWHPEGIISPTHHANGITPGGIRGKMDGDKVKKAEDKDRNRDGKLGDGGDTCDNHCQEELEDDNH